MPTINNYSSNYNSIIDSKKLSTFINDLKNTDDKQKIDLAISIIKTNSKITKDLTSSKELSTFIDNLAIKDDEQKTDLAIAIIKLKPYIIDDLTTSGNLSTFINGLGITDGKQKIDLAIAIIKLSHSIVYDLRASENLLTFIDDLKIEDDEQEKNLATIIYSHPKNQPTSYHHLKMIRKENKESELRKIQDNTNKHDNINKIHISTFNPNIIDSEVDVAEKNPQSQCKLWVTTREIKLILTMKAFKII